MLDPSAPVGFAGGSCLAGPRWLAVRGADRTGVRLVSLTTGLVEAHLRPPPEAADRPVLRLHGDSTGSLLAADHGRGRLVLWQLERLGDPGRVVVDADVSRVPLAIDPAGRQLAAAVGDEVRIWVPTSDPVEPASRLPLTGGLRVERLLWSPGGTRLAGVLADGAVVCWSVPGPRAPVHLGGNLVESAAAVWLDEEHLVLAEVAGPREAPRRPCTVRVRPALEPAGPAELPIDLPTQVKAMASSPDRTTVAVHRWAPVGQPGDLVSLHPVEGRTVGAASVTSSLPAGFDGRLSWHPEQPLLVLDGAREVVFLDAHRAGRLCSFVLLDEDPDGVVWLGDGLCSTNRERHLQVREPSVSGQDLVLSGERRAAHLAAANRWEPVAARLNPGSPRAPGSGS